MQIKEQLSKASTLEQKLRCVVHLFTLSSTQTVTRTELTKLVLSHLKTTQLMEKYAPSEKIEQDLLLIEDSSVILPNDVTEVKAALSNVIVL